MGTNSSALGPGCLCLIALAAAAGTIPKRQALLSPWPRTSHAELQHLPDGYQRGPVSDAAAAKGLDAGFPPRGSCPLPHRGPSQQVGYGFGGGHTHTTHASASVTPPQAPSPGSVGRVWCVTRLFLFVLS